ncbi:MAG: ornithine carbamoyltransferase [bacterium (Candidatus Ratteibacteria) CG_4_10_14_3_um_filter_41_18]|uniref:Ornithine carbamoyltransferase n=3 Tax=Candidatus Ratteibacteria TaxID=2979319 RepID=A0A2M7YFY3_9BACT|nr:ornithine carbamoyltransferase [Candidatus Peregrinibacteria bacterium]PIW32546.1 MAG: ornithine carbamoyltransferase [bacterium (Candidatus Ratteibacteria) CG15_BIG_FIL_POST_REV_8_21_14_020_41_12]PIX77137.1 MAG: ornithine carbamoyltransferase [bacterium (Candidatus Ratteibacteria) CG_4_10_14_3_um_filter_41_18]PJA61881.1 MAG: ornithine carbamoyltransferase [bacterium (Candidatus Ratteibacteria) CG_4_9_14_3_um_filter_41_21]HCG77565.1 ornithine carbamoyltransferase [bacterium]
MKKDLLCIADLSEEEILKLFTLAKSLKERRKRGEKIVPLLFGKVLGMLFRKPSTRTRISFEVGMFELGGRAIFLTDQNLQISRGETISDTAKVLSSYLDGILIRTSKQEEVEEFAKYSEIPIINGLSDTYHPCQVLSDYFTLWEKRELKKIKVTYIGDGNNVCHSLISGADKLGVRLSVVTPKEYPPKKEILARVRNKKRITLSHNPCDIRDSDVIYTDTWISMGAEKEKEKRIAVFKDYQLNKKLLKKAKKELLVMHCLPAHRGEEITDEVMDAPFSIVFEQAVNRLHLQKAILATLLK